MAYVNNQQRHIKTNPNPHTNPKIIQAILSKQEKLKTTNVCAQMTKGENNISSNEPECFCVHCCTHCVSLVHFIICAKVYWRRNVAKQLPKEGGSCS